MIPELRLSSTLMFAPLATDIDLQPSNLESKGLGGIALQDPTQGLEVQVWTLTVVTSDLPAVEDQVFVTPTLTGVPQYLFSALNITEVSLAFDTNMNIFVAFVTDGVAKYYWYDTVVEQQIISSLPVGSTTPRATLDDHREMNYSNADIILAYIRAGTLYFRAQRDRYTVEYPLFVDLFLTVPNPKIHSVSMNQGLRLQFSIRGNFG